MNIEQLRRELKSQKVDIWQCDYFDISGRIQVVTMLKQSRFRDKVKFKTAENQIRIILKAIRKVGTDGYDVRIGIKILNGATILTAIFSEDVVNNTDWSKQDIVWRDVSLGFNVASLLPGRPRWLDQ